MARSVDLPLPDPTIHPVGNDHTGRAAREQVALLQKCGLQADHRILEIGCGIGRMVHELAPFLDGGTYVGFDISEVAIDWLNEHYAPLLPNFQFDWIDIHNARYHRQGRAKPETVRFPYQDDEFDFCCAFSVFTHMRLPEIRSYLAEVRRVLKPGGRAVLTFFAMTGPGENPQLSGKHDWVEIEPTVWTIAPDLPERGIGFDEPVIRDAVDAAGLDLVELVLGRWHGTFVPERQPDYMQDAVVVSPRA